MYGVTYEIIPSITQTYKFHIRTINITENKQIAQKQISSGRKHYIDAIRFLQYMHVRNNFRSEKHASNRNFLHE